MSIQCFDFTFMFRTIEYFKLIDVFFFIEEWDLRTFGRYSLEILGNWSTFIYLNKNDIFTLPKHTILQVKCLGGLSK